ncbi:MAG: branched-chain amino acid ABC transporter permease [Alphaproteobacteria bacterium]
METAQEKPSVILSLILVSAVLAVALTVLRDNAYALRILSLAGIYSILALGLRLAYAEVGELNLGQSVLFALGGYLVGIGGTQLGLGHLVGLAVAVAGTALVALIVSFITLRLAGAFFAVATLGLIPVATALIVNWDGITGGVLGLGGYGGGIRAPVPLVGISGQLAWMIAIWVVVLAALLLDHWLRAARFGQALNAIRQDPVLFASLGFNVTLYRVAAAVISGTFAGLAGGLYALHEGLVSVSLVGLGLLATIIVIVVAGGSRVPGGVVAASAIMTLVPEYARALGDLRLLVFGVALILLLKFMPDGVGPFGISGIARLIRLLGLGAETADTKPASRPSEPGRKV